jgi:GNAT superfamily N-acetyltransferase
MKQLTSTPEKVNEKTMPLYKKSFLTSLKKENTNEFVLEDSEKNIGHITLSFYWDFWHMCNVMIVDGVVVDKDFRRKGFGLELMKFAEDFARKNNVKQIYLYTDSKKEDAVRLYEKLGYVKKDKIFFFKKID